MKAAWFGRPVSVVLRVPWMPLSARVCQHGGVSEGLTYRDALKILGSAESRLAGLLDAAATGGLGAWAATSMLAGADATIALGCSS